MTDDVDRAVDGRIDAYRPSTVPPFADIEARKRRRDRSRLAAAGAAVGAVALATAALAVPGLSGQDEERLAPVTTPPSEARNAPPAWDGRRGPLAAGEGAAVSCVEMYNPTTLVNRTFAFDGTVSSIGGSVSNRSDMGQMELAGVTFTVNEWYRGGGQDSVTVDLPPAGPAGGAPDETDPAYEVGSRLLVSGEPRWDGEPLDQPIAWAMCGFTLYYDPETAQAWQDAFAGQDGPENLRVTTDGVTGARLCLADSSGEYPGTGCRQIGKDSADRLARALDGAQPMGRAPMCAAAGPTYRLMFDMPSARVVPIVIPTPCGPITVAQRRYRINDRVVSAVGTEYGREAKYAEFIDRCVGAENAASAPEYVGLTESEASSSGTDGPQIRVVGRDGACLGRDDDLRRDRVNLVIADGKVIWAGRF